MGTGIFEQSHFLMGFEDALMNLLLEPESMQELVAVSYTHLVLRHRRLRLYPDDQCGELLL